MQNIADLSQFFTEHAIQQMQENGLTLKKLGARLVHGVELEEAFTFKTRGRKSSLPKSLYDKAKANGISRQLLHKRIHSMGMSPEVAVSMPVNKRVDKTVI